MSGWGWIVGAIAAEVAATSALKASNGFTRLVPSVIVVVGYAASFWLLSLGLKAGVPVGISYAVWSAIGTVGVMLVGRFYYGEPTALLQWAGAGVIIAGVVMVNLGSAVH
jgi:small multidrug resistance pump